MIAISLNNLVSQLSHPQVDLLPPREQVAFWEKEFLKETVIVHTNNEITVRVLQAMVAEKKVKAEDTMIYYLTPINSKPIRMKLLDNGFFEEPAPEGFFGVPFELSIRLIRA